MFLSSAAPPGRAGKFTWLCMVRLGLSYSTWEKYFQVSVQLRVFHFEKAPFHKRLFFVCTEPVLMVITLMTSLGRLYYFLQLFYCLGALCKEHVLGDKQHVLGVTNSLNSLGGM